MVIISILLLNACASRKTTEMVPASTDSMVKTNTPVNEESTAIKTTDSTATAAVTKPAAAVPDCIQSLIAKFKAEKVQNPPRKIIQYTYRSSTVFYVPAICCDFYSDLYDANCTLIGHPDGGFTGKGDGKITGFSTEAKNAVLIWEDKRK